MNALRVASKFKATKSGLSLPPDVRRDGRARAKSLGVSFSQYVGLLIQNDCRAPDAPLVVYAAPRLER